MKSRSFVVLATVPVLLLLVGCAPAINLASPPQITNPGATATPTATTTAAPTATPTATPTAPPVINAADYLISGHPHHPDSSGEWSGDWEFFTDDTKTVVCSLTAYSGDSGGAFCGVVPGKTGLVTYTIPAGASNHCDLGASNAADGYSLAAGSNSLGPDKYAGFSGCATADFWPPADLAKTKVLPDGATLKVETFTCTVLSGVATCTDKNLYAGHSGTITFGLNIAKFSQT